MAASDRAIEAADALARADLLQTVTGHAYATLPLVDQLGLIAHAASIIDQALAGTRKPRDHSAEHRRREALAQERGYPTYYAYRQAMKRWDDSDG